MPNIGFPELIIVLVIALLLFGGSRLAGLGKGVGRSIREFKEEVKSAEQVPEKSEEPEVVEAEIVDERAADLARRQRELEAREQALKEAELKAREDALKTRETGLGN
ncbi:MAG: twin-arginine translocase TatA/TatE family subunit [Propionibacteriaceae bacterium]|nr:twin-arginine translocase TatA/TatE family subunit [Propionibacteriaceae bacterium]